MDRLTARRPPPAKPVSLDVARMRKAAAEATAVLRVLGNADRLMLLCQLVHGERCVGDLEALLGIQQPTLSQQLGVLRQEGVVATRREGKRVYYRIADRRVGVLLGQLYDLFCRR